MSKQPVNALSSMPALGGGQVAFALAMAGLGVLSLMHGDFALQWQPVPEWVPLRQALAYVSGIILLAGGLGLLFRRIAARAALLLSVYLLVLWVLPQLARVVPSPLHIGSLLGFCETVAVMSGSWILAALLLRQDGTRIRRFVDSDAGLRSARLLFGVACVIFGLAHFAYADFTASMIPQWFPERMWFAYLTGAGHVAAGLGIVFAILPRLAATLEALMMSSFVLFVHIPSIAATPPFDWAPTSRIQWTALFWALALAASAWMVASSLREHPWGLRRTTPPR